MSAPTQVSFVVSLLLALSAFAALQVLKPTLASTPALTVVGGISSSVFFLFLLTAVGNLETLLFGKGFQTKLLEVAVCLVVSCTAAGAVHRVCTTVCFLFSVGILYYMNRLSTAKYAAPVAAQPAPSKKRR